MIWIIFEGVDSSGKSTQIQMTKNFLQSQNLFSLTTREVGGTPFGEQIRKILHKKDLDQNPDPIRDLLIITSARREHLHNLQKQNPPLILCDRFLDSTLVYQNEDPTLIPLIQKTNATYLPELKGSFLIFFFYFEKKEDLKERLKLKSETPDRFDQRSFQMIWETNEKYKKLLQDQPNWYPFQKKDLKIQRQGIQAHFSLESIQRKIQFHVKKFLKSEGKL